MNKQIDPVIHSGWEKTPSCDKAIFKLHEKSTDEWFCLQHENVHRLSFEIANCRYALATIYININDYWFLIPDSIWIGKYVTITQYVYYISISKYYNISDNFH